MAETTIDYQAVFRTLPGAVALLSADGTILDVNEGYLEASGQPLERVLGQKIFDAFPGNPDDPDDSGAARLRVSLQAVVGSGEADIMAPVRYDVEDPGKPGEFEERYWAVINTPIHGDDGQLELIVHRADEVTHIVNQLRNAVADHG